MLHKEFGRERVNEVVADYLNKRAPFCTSRTHDLIATISSDTDRRAQIVTTNFDHLFEGCGDVNQIHISERFPEIENGEPIDGVVYLHGRLQDSGDTQGVTSHPQHNYVLGKKDFATAYLTGKRVTDFMTELFKRYTVVIIGYRSKDPLFEYLLLGLEDTIRESGINHYVFEGGSGHDSGESWGDLPENCAPYLL